MTHGYTNLLPIKFPEDQTIVVQGEDAKPTLLNQKQFSKLFGFELQHGLFYRSEDQNLVEALRKKELKDFDEKSPLYQALKTYLNNPINYFDIIFLNKVCGFLAIANQDISADVISGFYSAVLTFQKLNAPLTKPYLDSTYRITTHDEIELDGNKYRITIDAKEIGDLTRFCAHLPDKEDLDEMTELLDSTISKDKILLNNIYYGPINCEGVRVTGWKTMTSIKKGLPVGINYGNTYWKSRKILPHLFLQDGEVIRIVAYDKTKNKYFITDETVKITPHQLRDHKSAYGPSGQTIFANKSRKRKADAEPLTDQSEEAPQSTPKPPSLNAATATSL